MRPVDRIIEVAEEDPEDWQRIEREFVDRGQLIPLWDRAMSDPPRALRITLALRRYCFLRDLEDVYLEHARRIPAEAVETADPGDVLRVRVSMGQSAAMLGDADAALHHYQQVLDSEDVDEHDFKADVYNNMAEIRAVQGDWDSAIEYYELAIARLRRPGAGREGLPVFLSNLGKLLGRRGRLHEALAYHRKALDALSGLDRPEVEHIIWQRIAGIHDDLGEPHDAIAAYERALPLCLAAGDRRGEANIHSGLALTYAHLGRHDEAHEKLEAAMRVGEQLPRFDRRTLINNLATVLADLGNPDRALQYLRHVLDLETADGDLVGQAVAQNNIGLTLFRLERYEGAREHYFRALRLWQGTQHLLGMGRTLHNLAVAEIELRELPNAMRHLLRALRIQRRVDSQSDLAITLNNIGLVLHRTAQPMRAVPFYLRAIEIHIATDNADELATSRSNLAELHRDHDEPLEQPSSCGVEELFAAGFADGPVCDSTESRR